MILQTIIALIILNNLRKQLNKSESLEKWKYFLLGAAAVFVGLIVLYSVIKSARPSLIFLSSACAAVLVFLILTQKDFRASKSFMYAFLPLMAVYFVQELAKIMSARFYNKWDNFFETGEAFAFLWMIAMLVVNSRQRKALEKERAKAEAKETEYRITQKLKAELEVQVKERTAELTTQKEELQQALNDLQATQAQLIQSEKMASLGELTAGIAHEIQNPLNFVNNFSEVNKELLAEMNVEIEKGNYDEVRDIAKDIADNEEKINHHGKRADAIVKGMLQHSRSSSSVKEPTDINKLADEYFRLAYHGLRAKDKSFNATLKTDFDESIGNINIVPQDIGRVILNLITNAFYAAALPREGGFSDPDYKHNPTVWVSTKKAGNNVEIKVRDNGPGIPHKILDKIFQPFFTTKPTGQGTGLGLSMSYDIVTKGHNGELTVVTNETEGTTFTITIPV